MAHLRFMHPQYSRITGSIKRAQQLVRSQYAYLERHPGLASRNLRHLRSIAQRLNILSQLPPQNVDKTELAHLLQELSAIVAGIQQAA